VQHKQQGNDGRLAGHVMDGNPPGGASMFQMRLPWHGADVGVHGFDVGPSDQQAVQHGGGGQHSVKGDGTNVHSEHGPTELGEMGERSGDGGQLRWWWPWWWVGWPWGGRACHGGSVAVRSFVVTHDAVAINAHLPVSLSLI